jgi:citrate synthase
MADAPEVLFSITREHLNTGLRGFPVGTCRTSAVDPLQGVSYVGYPVADLAFLDPEEVIYLLFERKLPSPEELAAFKADLRARAGLDPRVLTMLRGLPRDGHPMEWLQAGLLFLGMTRKTGDYTEDAKNLVAWAPELVAAIFRLRSGWGDPIASQLKSGVGLVEDFVQMLGVPGADPDKLVRLLRVFYVLHLDHGGGNLSTFVGKAVASSLTDVFSSMTAAMGGLYGPLHGRANQDCLEFVQKVGTSDPAQVEKFVRGELESGGKIFGFGHAVLRAEDPRATIEYALGEQICPDDPLFAVARTLREVASRVLQQMPKVSNPFPNVDAVSGTLLHAMGLTDPEYYTVLFGLSRITGIAAQIVDERLHLRGGKGVPIYRPKYLPEDQPKRRLTR